MINGITSRVGFVVIQDSIHFNITSAVDDKRERKYISRKKPTCLHAQLLRHHTRRIMHIKPNK